MRIGVRGCGSHVVRVVGGDVVRGRVACGRVARGLVACGLVACDLHSGPAAIEADPERPGATSSDDSDGSADGAELACTPEAGLELYERRIAPLLEDDRPSTCNQCHLSGVELSLFVQASPCETMACMVQEGIVDLDAPQHSTVLAWIDRAQPRGGITQDTIDTERQAMLDWIEMTAACEGALCEPVDDPCGHPPDESDCEFPPPVYESMSLDDPGDCSDLTLELVWREKVYSWRSRCFPCHFDSWDEDFEEATPWIATGACNPASLRTLHNAERFGYLDAKAPERSLLLTKPLAESLGGVEHGGGPKMHTLDEPTYRDFAYFVQRWADCQ
ncbi:MAG: hypothetical protein AAGF11_36740 [Myxococcota bacterium]